MLPQNRSMKSRCKERALLILNMKNNNDNNKIKPKRIKPMHKYTNKNISQNQNSTDFILR